MFRGLHWKIWLVCKATIEWLYRELQCPRWPRDYCDLMCGDRPCFSRPPPSGSFCAVACTLLGFLGYRRAEVVPAHPGAVSVEADAGAGCRDEERETASDRRAMTWDVNPWATAPSARASGVIVSTTPSKSTAMPATAGRPDRIVRAARRCSLHTVGLIVGEKCARSMTAAARRSQPRACCC